MSDPKQVQNKIRETQRFNQKMDTNFTQVFIFGHFGSDTLLDVWLVAASAFWRHVITVYDVATFDGVATQPYPKRFLNSKENELEQSEEWKDEGEEIKQTS